MLWVFVNCAMVLQNASVSSFFNYQMLSMRGNVFKSRISRTDWSSQKSLLPARQAEQTNQGRTSFVCTPWVPISLNSLQGPPLSSLYKPTTCFNEVSFLWLRSEATNTTRNQLWKDCHQESLETTQHFFLLENLHSSLEPPYWGERPRLNKPSGWTGD